MDESPLYLVCVMGVRRKSAGSRAEEDTLVWCVVSVAGGAQLGCVNRHTRLETMQVNLKVDLTV